MKSFVSIVMIALLMWSCASTAEFKTSKVTPAATGKVKVKELKNSNFSVEVNISNLADPDRLNPSRDCYVVWSKSGEGTYNIGKLVKGEGTEWSLTTQSTYEPKRIIISAEKDEKATDIGRVKVLKSKKL